MPTYTHIRWEAGPSGWELYGVEQFNDFVQWEGVALLAWVFEIQRTHKWNAIVYDGSGFDAQKEFDTLEEAQAWCVACVRMS